jgi:hypothetical protein
VDTGTGVGGPDLRGPDGPECASAALGLALSQSAARLTACPAARLDSADAAALHGIVRFIANREIRAISVVADASPRGRAARALIAADAASYGMTVGEPASSRPMVIVSGWSPALAAVRDVASGRSMAQGTYLAPWLFNTAILGPPAGQLIPLRFDPAATPALGYLTALSTWFPDEAPSSDGYLAWSGASGGTLRLYAAAEISGANMGGMPGMPGSGDQMTMPGTLAIGENGWLPDGSIIPVTRLR